MIEERINNEIKTADKNYGSFNSTHEVYGVIQEEIDEFWDLVKLKSKTILHEKEMIAELIQISAIAKRAAIQIENHQIKYL